MRVTKEEKKRKRPKKIHKERRTERDRNRFVFRQTDLQTHSQIDRQKERDRNKFVFHSYFSNKICLVVTWNSVTQSVAINVVFEGYLVDCNRQTDRQTDGLTYTQTDTQTDTQTHKQEGRHKDRQSVFDGYLVDCKYLRSWTLSISLFVP
jgi:hypothetical protein